jgi:hypothetical protein
VKCRIAGIAKPACAVLLAVVASPVFGQDIPSGVHYKKASPEVNAKFSKMLGDLLAGKIPDAKLKDCVADVMICGPGFWPAVLKIERETAGGKEATFMVPIPGKSEPRVFHGRAFKSIDDRLNFLGTIVAVGLLSPMKVRPLTRAEIGYYWAIIPYDIEEPILAAESKKITLFFHAEKGKIMFVDVPTTPSTPAK